MEDPSAFANMYIERIINEVVELTKVRLMNETRIAYLEKVNVELLEQIQNQSEVKKKQKINKHSEVDIFDNSSV